MKKRGPRGSYTREKAKFRREKSEERQNHIEAIATGEVDEELPEPLTPDVFKDIEEIYWSVLKKVPDPRSSAKRVYPLELILHRVISGLLGGAKCIGVLFPKKRRKVEPGKKKLGSLPTRKPVYELLRRIDWSEANAILHPLWERLGYTPDLIVQRPFRDPKIILNEFQTKQDKAEKERLEELAQKRKEMERSEGMSAAQAKRSPSRTKARNEKGEPNHQEEKALSKENASMRDGEVTQKACNTIKVTHNLVLDGKVVKSSYNSGVTERFVHVTEISEDENGNRRRFIIGTRPTELDRKGEWGAALSVLDALTPLPNDAVVLVSGDAGLCVEKFCEWLTENHFFLQLSDQS